MLDIYKTHMLSSEIFHSLEWISIRNTRPLTLSDCKTIAATLNNCNEFRDCEITPDYACEGGIMFSSDCTKYKALRFTGAYCPRNFHFIGETFESWHDGDEVVATWKNFLTRMVNRKLGHKKVGLACKCHKTVPKWTRTELNAVKSALIGSGAFAPLRTSKR